MNSQSITIVDSLTPQFSYELYMHKKLRFFGYTSQHLHKFLGFLSR
jgi:hypothetical protein